MYTPEKVIPFLFKGLACENPVEKGEGYLCTSLHL